MSDTILLMAYSRLKRSRASGRSWLTERRISLMPSLVTLEISSSWSFICWGDVPMVARQASIPAAIPVRVCPRVSWISLARRFLSRVSAVQGVYLVQISLLLVDDVHTVHHKHDYIQGYQDIIAAEQILLGGCIVK